MSITYQQILERDADERAARREYEIAQDARWAWLPQSDADEMVKLDRFLGWHPSYVDPKKLYRLWGHYSADAMATFLVVDPITVSGFLGWLVERSAS
jgi:hypothetical protein